MVVNYRRVTEVDGVDARNYRITTLDIEGKNIYKEENVRKV